MAFEHSRLKKFEIWLLWKRTNELVRQGNIESTQLQRQKIWKWNIKSHEYTGQLAFFSERNRLRLMPNKLKLKRTYVPGKSSKESNGDFLHTDCFSPFVFELDLCYFSPNQVVDGCSVSHCRKMFLRWKAKLSPSQKRLRAKQTDYTLYLAHYTVSRRMHLLISMRWYSSNNDPHLFHPSGRYSCCAMFPLARTLPLCSQRWGLHSSPVLEQITYELR